MRIAMVSEHASPLAAVGGVDAGGQNVHVDCLARTLTMQDHDVVVHTRRDSPALPPRVSVDGYVVDHLDAGPARELPKDDLLPLVPAMSAQLTQRWLADPPDVIHAHFWMSTMAALSARRAGGLALADIPVVTTFHALGIVKRAHQGLADSSPRGRVRLERELARRVDHIVATAPEEARQLMQWGVEPSRISVVPCGVDVLRFSPAGSPGAPPRPGRAPRILTLSRLVPRKGVADVIQAMAGITGAELVVAGGPRAAALGTDPEAQRLREVAEAAGVADRVRLVGAVSRQDVPGVLRSADVVVCAPWYEPFGMVALEAMACALPVVATAVGGLQDTVVDGVTGLLVAPRSPAEIAAAVTALLADPGRAAAMGRAGLHRVREGYDWDRVAEQTCQAYGRVTGSRRVLASAVREQVAG